MRIRTSIAICSLLVAAATLHAAPANPSASFTVSSKLHVPGETLKKGDYTIQVLNRLSDRVILRVDDAKGKERATFIGVPNKEISKPGANGSVPWPNLVGKATYVEGWSFPGLSAVIEFVYPKAEAVSIAKANPAKVPAVDPASEGKPADKDLSADDMQLLTLWLLSLQQVGPGAPAGGIKAERYQLTASVEYKPTIKALPHTASLMPLEWILGFGAAFAALWLRRARIVRGHSARVAAFAGKG